MERVDIVMRLIRQYEKVDVHYEDRNNKRHSRQLGRYR